MADLKLARRAIGLAGLGLCAAGASAQEAPLSWAATQPARGRITWRESFTYTRYERDGADAERFAVNTRLSLGLSGRLSASLDLPMVSKRATDGSERTSGLGDASLSLKWRFWQHDTGAIETNRLALLGGVRLPSGESDLSSGGLDPYLGLVFTRVQGRHGLNASARYLVTTDGRDDPLSAGMGDADLLTLETSYLYRLSPGSYGPDTVGAWYAVVESFVDYETNGDAEWRLAPGLLWEARRWAAEASVILPVARSIDDRAETDWGLALGLRVLF